MESINLRRKSVNKPPLPTTKTDLQALFSKCLNDIKRSLKSNKFSTVSKGADWRSHANMDTKKPSMTLEVRDYGNWECDMIEDNDQSEMSDASFDVVVDKVMAIHKLYPNLAFSIETGEKNWLCITVK